MSIVTLGVVGIVALVCILAYIRRWQKPKNSPPYEPGMIPYLGCGIPFGKSPVETATNMHKKVNNLYL